MKDATAGDPMGGLRWTRKSTRQLAAALRRRGFHIGHVTVGRLLRKRRYALLANRKRLSGKKDPNRDRQFRLLVRRRRWFLKRGLPVISVDTKKKEHIANFKNSGRCWRRKAQDVLDHDFPSAATGRFIPYGIYDVGRNVGFVVAGVSHETSQFAVAALRAWWLQVGRHAYPKARRLNIEADCGGANGNRRWAWKLGLQRLADEFDLTITVSHVPTSASKHNLIEHRMFSRISNNWAGEPLTNYEKALKFIRATKTKTGFRCRAILNRREYPTKIPISDKEKNGMNWTPHPVLPKWNYTIRPRKHKKA